MPSSNVVSFYSYPPYYGNAKAIYNYLKQLGIEKKFNIKLLWLVSDKKEEEILKGNSIDACYIMNTLCLEKYIRSKIHVSDSFFIRSKYLFKGRGTFFLATWHGIPFKMALVKCERTNDTVVDVALATSAFTIPLLSAFLGIRPSKFRITGYPRNDALLRMNKDVAKEKISKIMKINVKEYDSIILYAPTFRYTYRVTGKRNYIEGEPIRYIGNMNEKQIEKLNKVLKEYNALFIIKYHHFDEFYLDKVLKVYNKMKKEKYTNIKILSSDEMLKYKADLYEVLPGVDVLVTDYSSVFYDYLLLDRPIIFYMYDLEKYYKDAGLIVSPKNVQYFLPGPVTKKADEFISEVEKVLKGIDTFSEKRREFTDLIHEFKDSNSARRVWELIIKPVLEERNNGK